MEAPFRRSAFLSTSVVIELKVRVDRYKFSTKHSHRDVNADISSSNDLWPRFAK